jgi:hypothetical protein
MGDYRIVGYSIYNLYCHNIPCSKDLPRGHLYAWQTQLLEGFVAVDEGEITPNILYRQDKRLTKLFLVSLIIAIATI